MEWFMDDETRKLIKKYESNMIISGRGMLFFGLWDVLKIIVGVLYDSGNEYNRQLKALIAQDEIYGVVMWVAISLACAAVMSFALFIGIRAIMYGRGTRRKNGFLILVVLLGIINIMGIPQYFVQIKEDLTQLDVAIATILMDLSFASMSFDMVYSAIRLSAISRKILKET
jgi:hypothetical protein